MKLRLVIGAFALLLAGPALGQAVYPYSASANDIVALTADVTPWNTAVCEAQGLVAGCTQSAARRALCVRNGLASNCTYAEGRDAWCARNSTRPKAPCPGMPTVIIAATAEDLFGARVTEAIDKLKASQRESTAVSDCAAWRAASDAARNNACSALGRANGCDLCPQ